MDQSYLRSFASKEYSFINAIGSEKLDVQPEKGFLVEQAIFTTSGRFPPWKTDKSSIGKLRVAV